MKYANLRTSMAGGKWSIGHLLGRVPDLVPIGTRSRRRDVLQVPVDGKFGQQRHVDVKFCKLATSRGLAANMSTSTSFRTSRRREVWSTGAVNWGVFDGSQLGSQLVEGTWPWAYGCGPMVGQLTSQQEVPDQLLTAAPYKGQSTGQPGGVKRSWTRLQPLPSTVSRKMAGRCRASSWLLYAV